MEAQIQFKNDLLLIKQVPGALNLVGRIMPLQNAFEWNEDAQQLVVYRWFRVGEEKVLLNSSASGLWVINVKGFGALHSFISNDISKLWKFKL